MLVAFALLGVGIIVFAVLDPHDYFHGKARACIGLVAAPLVVLLAANSRALAWARESGSRYGRDDALGDRPMRERHQCGSVTHHGRGSASKQQPAGCDSSRLRRCEG